VKIQDHLVLMLGARHDRVDTEFDNKDAGVDLDYDNDEWTANAGLVWLFGNGLTAYTSYSQFFQPIIQLDANNNPAKPESGDQVEVGLKFQPDGFDGYFNAAAFKIRQENLASGTAGTPSFRQIGEVQSQGVELEGVANITPSLSFVANATLVDPEIKSDARGAAVEGNQPNQVAKRLMSAWVKYQFLQGPLKGFSIGGGGRYVGSTYGDDLESKSMKVPSYTVADATVAYQWNDFKFQVAAKNVLDKEYVATCNYWCWYGDRRNVIGSVTYAW
jgi:iron complex outermembrane receptor protein